MKRLLIALLALLPFQVDASGLQASFTGSNLDGLTRPTTRFEYKSNLVPSSGNLVDSSGRSHDLAPTGGTPASTTTPFQDSSGRRYIGRAFDGSGMRYSVAHHADFNMFDANHTVTLVVLASSAGAGTDGLIGHFDANGGMEVELSGTNYMMYYGKAGGSYVLVNNAGTYRDDKYHVVQIVRESDYATVYVDGVAGTRTSVAGYGLSATATLDIGASAGGFTPWLGNVLYVRADAEALSLDRLNYERNQILGIGPRSGTADVGYTFSRTTTASQTHSDGTISYVAAGIPKVGGSGGGVVVESQSTNLLTYSQAQSNAAWSVTNLTNPPVAYTGADPAGGATAYVLAEDGTAGAEHKIARASWVTVSASTPYTLSVWLKAINRTWAALMIYENGGTSYYAYFDIANGKVGTTSGSPVTKIEQYANGWFRCSVQHATGGGITQVDTAVYVAEADNDWTFNGASQSSIAMFGAQFENSYFPTSYISTTSASVTRTADYLTVPPNKLGKDMLVGSEKMWMDFTQDPAGRTNLILQSQTYGTTWAPIRATISENTALALAPDNTQTADILVEDGTAAATHYVGQSVATVSGTTYTFSVILKAASRSWARISANTDAAEANFNISTGEIGTITGATAYIKSLGGGWYRCSVTWTSVTTGSQSFRIYALNSNSSSTFDGVNGQNATYLWGSQLEASATLLGYIATTTTSRTAISSNDGLFAFDKSGTVIRNSEYAKGEYYQLFNGTDSQYVVADAAGAFRPAGNFSIVVIAKPDALPSAANFMYMFGKYTTTGDKRSWALYYNDGGDYTFAVSQTGTSLTTSFVQKTDGVQLGRPAFIVATFECSNYPTCTPGNTHTAKIYVDDTTVATDSAFYGPPASNDANMNIARSGGGSRFQGELYYVAYLDGVVLSQAQVSALYAKAKQANILPVGLGTGYVGQNLTIEFEAKCSFASSTDMGADRSLISLGSYYFTGTSPGGATSTRNYINIFAESSDGKVYADFYSGSSTTRRYMYSAAITTYNKWHKYKVFYDFSNLASSNIWVDGAAGTLDASMTAASHYFNITDTYIKLGQPNNTAVTGNTPYGTPDGNCAIRNLRIVPARI